MNRWSRGLAQVIFAFVIVSLAALAGISAGAILHTQSNIIFGVAFLATIACLVLLFEKKLPSVYPCVKRRPWWQGRMGEAVLVTALGMISSILSSRMDTIYFGLLIVSGCLVALLLHVRRKEGEF
jgi:NADH:ubiquinone oxidoreductase subunit 2 (subunit N)